MTSPAAESATKTSPFGATDNQRGETKSLAKTEIAKPEGTWGRKFGGGVITTGQFSTRVNLDSTLACHPPTLNVKKISAVARLTEVTTRKTRARALLTFIGGSKRGSPFFEIVSEGETQHWVEKCRGACASSGQEQA
jgi:hypothetical protein